MDRSVTLPVSVALAADVDLCSTVRDRERIGTGSVNQLGNFPEPKGIMM